MGSGLWVLTGDVSVFFVGTEICDSDAEWDNINIYISMSWSWCGIDCWFFFVCMKFYV